MEHLIIQAYSDDKFRSKQGGQITILLNPENVKTGKRIRYNKDKQLGAIGKNNIFDRYDSENLSFDFTIDCTGAVEGTLQSDTVTVKVKEIEDSVYCYNSELHRPSYVEIVYGSVMFKGQVAKMNVDYSLFNGAGDALRAKVGMEFVGYMASDEERKKYPKNSPDMSRLITVKDGDTLAKLCYETYGDSTLVAQVARFNNLNGFRNIPAGTELLFPPLRKSQ